MDPGKIANGVPSLNKDKSPEGDQELREAFMIGSEGICEDYFNQILAIEAHCKSLLGVPDWVGLPPEEERENLLDSISTCVSYTEFFTRSTKDSKVAMTKFLTERGKEIWKRLDEIIKDIKLIGQSGLEQADLEKLDTLFGEAKSYLCD